MTSTIRETGMLTDRGERALVAAVERRISQPLRFAAGRASLRALGRFARSRFAPGRPRGSAQERESLSCQPAPHLPPGPAPTAR
ncbi:hypothetical protein [Streptomyces sp. NPDC054838]